MNNSYNNNNPNDRNYRQNYGSNYSSRSNSNYPNNSRYSQGNNIRGQQPYSPQGRQYQGRPSYNNRGQQPYSPQGRQYQGRPSYNNRGAVAKKSRPMVVLAIILAVVLLAGAAVGGFFVFNSNSALITPKNLTVVGDKENTIGWDNVKKANKYVIRLDGNNPDQRFVDANTNEKNLNELELNRTFTVDVKAKNNSQESGFSESIYFERKPLEGTTTLPTPTNVILDSEAKLLSWQNVANATNYDVLLNGNHNITQETHFSLSNLSNGTYVIVLIAKGDGQVYDDSAPVSINFDNKPDSATKLDTPSNLYIDGSTLRWNPVANADKYSIYVDGTHNRQVDNASFSLASLNDLGIGTYSLQVQAKSNSLNYKDSDFSSAVEYQVTSPPSEKPKLQTPSMTIDKNAKKVSWNKIDNASGYAVNIDGIDNKTSASSTSYDLSELSGGTHIIKVKAKGDGGINYNDSDYSQSQEYVVEGNTMPLPAPTVKLWNDEKFVSWDQVKHATGYTIDINGTAYGVNANTVAFKIEFLGKGTHNIKVKAIGTAQYADSDWSNTVQYVVESESTAPPNLIKLDTPTGLRIESTNLYWTPVTEASGYMVRVSKIGGESADLPVGQGGVPQQSLGNYHNGIYALSVQAKGDGETYGDSDWSSTINYEHSNPDATPLPTPTGLHVEEGTDGVNHLKWDGTAINPASGGWHVDIAGEIIHTWNNDVSLDGVSSGVYTLRVQALPQDTETGKTPSAWAELVWDNQTAKLDTPVIRLDSANRKVSWNTIEEATLYEVNINGIPYQTNAPSTEFDLSILSTIGSYTIKVKAIDKTVPKLSSSDWSNEVVYAPDTVLIDAPIGYVADGKLNWYLVNNATGYDIEIDGQVVAQVGAVTTEYDLSYLTETRTYKIRIMAIGDGGKYLNSAWSADINYLFTNNPPLTGPTSPDAAVDRFEQFFPKDEYDNIFAHRLGTRAWKDDAEAQSYYGDPFDRENRTDFYSYDNFVKAIRTLSTKQVEMYDREGMVYWGSSRLTVIDKLTGQRIVIQDGNPELDAEWNLEKPVIRTIVDFGEFMLGDNENDSKRELAAFLANISHETNGGYRGVNTPADRYTYGLFWNEELAFIGATSSYYQNDDPKYPAVPGHSYHGRGPIQITWQYNYGPFSDIVFLDKNVLLQRPELVSEDGSLGFMAGLWFWMTPQYPKASCHDVIMGKYTPERNEDMQYIVDGTTKHFALTIVIINGGFEAGKGPGESSSVEDRVGYYETYAKRFGANIEGEKLYTDGFTPWG